MALARWKDLCIDVTAPAAASPEPTFWAATLNLTYEPDAADHAEAGRLVGELPTQTVWLNVVPEPKTVKNRVHLDVAAASVAEVVARGARTQSEPGEFRWTVMADPEGQDFCVFVRDVVPAYRIYELGVDSVDAAAQAAWWQTVLGGETGSEHGYSWLAKVPGVPFESFDFVPVPEPKTTKNRVHWDVVLHDEAALDALVAHGATVLRPRDDEIDWDVLADPEGNEFCAFLPA